MGSLGAPELLIILAIVLLLFGSTRLPKMARSLGQASKEFKKGIDHGAQDDDDEAPATDKATTDKATPDEATRVVTEKAEAVEPAQTVSETPAEKSAGKTTEPATEKAAGEAKS